MNPEYEALQQVQDALHIFLKGLQEFMPIPVQRVRSCNVYPNPEFQSYDCYAQYSNEPTNYDDEFRQVHDELHNAVLTADEHEGTPLAMLADHLQQYGQPGGLLMAEGAKYRPNGFQRLYHTEDVDSIRDSNGEANVYLDPVHRHDVPGFASIQAAKREVPVKEPRTGSYLRIYHNSYSAPQEIGIDYRVPVLSHRHLNEMLADLPEHVRQKTIEHVYHADPNLPEDHEEPQQLSRYDDDSFGYPSFTDMRLPPPTIPGSIAPGSTQSLEQFGSPWVSPAGFPKQAQAGRQFSRYADGDSTDYAAPVNEIHEILNSAPGAGGDGQDSPNHDRWYDEEDEEDEEPTEYSDNYSHADFQANIAQNPKDITSHLVYADWLRENGQPHMADAIQHWANPDLWSQWGRAGISPREPKYMREDTRGEHESGRFRAAAWVPSGFSAEQGMKPIVNIFARDQSDPTKDIQWYVPMPSAEEAARIEKGINGDNAQANYDDTGESTEGFSGSEQPDRDYWRSPYPSDGKNRYSRTDYSHQAFQDRAQEAPHDTVNRQVYADWLEDYAPHTASQDTLNFLRNHQGNAWISTHPQTGEVKSGPHYTWDDIRKANGETSHFNEMFPNEYHGWFSPDGIGQDHTPHGEPHSGPGGTHFVTESGDPLYGEHSYNTWQFHPDTGGISWQGSRHTSGDKSQEVHADAHQLSQTHTPVPQQASGLEQREVSEDVNFSRYSRLDYDFGDTDVTESSDEHMGTHYADNYTHADFLNAIHANPNESTHGLAYADWLEENGMPYHAHMVRSHVGNMQQWNTGRYPGDENFDPSGMSGFPHSRNNFPYEDHGFVVNAGVRPDSVQMQLVSPHVRDGNGNPRGGITWFHQEPDHQKAQEIVNGLASEGATVGQYSSLKHSEPQNLSRYSRTDYASEQELPAMLSSISPRAWRGWQHEQSPHFDMTPRLVAADYLDDLHADTGNQDYARQAAILRDTKKHAYLDPDGGIQDAHDLSRQLHRQYHPNIQGYTIRPDYLEPGFQQYLDTALWSSTDPDAGEPLDENHTYHNIHPATMAAMLADFRHFKATNQEKLADTSSGSSDHAHDFWLSRNGHGAGFWDKPEVYGGHGYDLQDAAEKHGEHDLYVGSDGMIHGSYEVQPTQDEPTQAARYSQVNYITTEEDFHRMLDENPHDHQTRMILADYLEDQNDPRAAGYRALGMRRRYATHWNPKAQGYDDQPYPESWDWGHDENLHYPNTSNALPRDWLNAVEGTNPSYANAQDKEYWTHHESRRAADDAAALGFARLSPERQAELLGQSQPTQASRYSDTAWSSGGGTLHEHHSDFRGKEKPFEGQRYYPETYQESVNYDDSSPQQEWRERDDIADWVSQPRTHLNNYPNLSPVIEQDGDQRYSMYARTDYSHEAFHHAIQEHPDDTVARGVYADWLEENDPNSVSPDTLHFLRSHPGNAWVAHHPETGEVVAGPHLSFDDIRAANGEQYEFLPPGRYGSGSMRGEHMGFFPTFATPQLEGNDEYGPFEAAPAEHAPHGKPHSGPGGHYFVTERALDYPGEGFNVWKFNPQTGGISNQGPTLNAPEHAHTQAAQAASGRPASVSDEPEQLSLYADDDSPQEQWTDPHAAFQASIYPELGGNPLDPMGHYVYSDFLREQGHHDEADFRQAMGDMASNGQFGLVPEGSHRTEASEGARWYMGLGSSPQWTAHHDIDYSPEQFLGNPAWGSYRETEDALHQAFMANRQQGQTG